MSTYPSQPLPRSHVGEQVAGSFVQAVNEARVRAEVVKLAAQDRAFEVATHQIENVRAVLSNLQHILGNDTTKHGEIAEHVEVGIRNARAALAQQAMTATFENVPRTGPIDYVLDGIAVQSKFINGIRQNLEHVLKHLERYDGFTDDGSYYIIPKDTYEAIARLLSGGHIDGLKGSSEDAVNALVRKIEEETGKPFAEVVQASVSTYAEVQVCTVSNTLDEEQDRLSGENQTRKDTISDQHKPSLRGACQAALIGGAVAGGMSFASGLYGKYKAGKNAFAGDFTIADWQEIGVDTAKGAAGGSFVAGSLYLMTNYAGLGAPFASAIVSAAKGLTSLAQLYNRGEIGLVELHDLGLIVCAESATVGVSTALGQTVVPVPVLGAVIGAMAGKMLMEFGARHDEQVARHLREQTAAFRAGLDDELRCVIEVISDRFDQFETLALIAFDHQLNSDLIGRSADLAQVYGVSADKVIRNVAQLDVFMLE